LLCGKHISYYDKNILTHVAESILPEVRSLMDYAIKFRQQNNHEKAIRLLTAAILQQNMAIEHLCSALLKVHKALQQLED